MSDDEDFNSESGDDFSASEDEWTPAKHKADNSEEDDDEEEAEASSGELDDDFAVPPPNKKKKEAVSRGSKPKTSNPKKSKKVTQKMKTPSLRDKMFKKYKPPPKTLTALNSKSVNKSPKVSTSKSTSNNDDSDSGSSVENFLVNPDEIDLQSSYFDVKANKDSAKQEENDPPDFDCNAGIAVEDNEDDDVDDMENVEEEQEDDNINSGIKKKDGVDVSPFKQFYDYKNTVDQVNKKSASIKLQSSNNDKPEDISSLLALGEASTSMTKEDKKVIKKSHRPPHKVKNSDSEWEEVEEDQSLEEIPKLKDGIEITVGFPETYQRRDKKQTDEQARFMRKFNRWIKENCLILHKVSLLCNIAHGVYLNKAINNTSLMAEALKLLPSKKSYPDGRTCIKYFESISKWYKAIMQLENDTVYSNLKKKPPIPVSLTLQIQRKTAICKKDFVLIFIILLRAMGIQCRLVMNLVTLPIRPSSDDLCSVKMKKPQEDKSSKKPSTSSSNKKISENENAVKKTINKKENKISESKKTDNIKISKSSKSSKNSLETSKNEEKNKSVQKSLNSNSSKIKEITVIPEIKISKSDSNENDIIKKEGKLFSPIKTRTRSKIKTDNNEKEADDKINKPSSSKIKSQNSRKNSRSPSPKFHISPHFIKESQNKQQKLEPQQSSSSNSTKKGSEEKSSKSRVTRTINHRSPSPKFNISPKFFQKVTTTNKDDNKINDNKKKSLKEKLKIPQLDGADGKKKSLKEKLKIPQLDGADGKKKSLKEKLKIPQLDGADGIPSPKKGKKLKKSLKEKVFADNSDSDSDFEISPPKKIKVESKLLSRVKLDRRVLSTDDENGRDNNDDNSQSSTNTKKKNTMDIWIEVYSETEDQWITIDLFKTKIHCVDNLRKGATAPVSYVFAWNNDNTLKDVSPRYCPQWNTVTRKQRVEKEWLQAAIKKYLGTKTSRDIAEDRELEKIHMDKPLPSTINEFKNHPLYALERHILKFEAIYPPNAPTLGFVRGEPIYPRDCIHTLHSREIWLKAARVVRPGEKPYKIVKARPKWDKLTSTVIKDQPLDIFGFWQTMEYEPPTAENGIVPRNAYGNVELFKPTMLPKKTVHLQLPGLNRVCKKLRIDCAPAVIGFDFHQGSCHPLLDGFVVCEEFKETVIAAWEQDQEEQARKELEKFEARIYGNWKRLIKGLLIRERLKIKYNFGNVSNDEDKTTKKRKK